VYKRQGLHRCSSLAVPSLIRALVIVRGHEHIEICLDLLQRAVILPAERHPVEFILDRLVEALDGPVGLRVPDLCPRMLDIVQANESLS